MTINRAVIIAGVASVLTAAAVITYYENRIAALPGPVAVAERGTAEGTSEAEDTRAAVEPANAGADCQAPAEQTEEAEAMRARLESAQAMVQKQRSTIRRLQVQLGRMHRSQAAAAAMTR